MSPVDNNALRFGRGPLLPRAGHRDRILSACSGSSTITTAATPSPSASRTACNIAPLNPRRGTGTNAFVDIRSAQPTRRSMVSWERLRASFLSRSTAISSAFVRTIRPGAGLVFSGMASGGLTAAAGESGAGRATLARASAAETIMYLPLPRRRGFFVPTFPAGLNCCAISSRSSKMSN